MDEIAYRYRFFFGTCPFSILTLEVEGNAGIAGGEKGSSIALRAHHNLTGFIYEPSMYPEFR